MPSFSEAPDYKHQKCVKNYQSCYDGSSVSCSQWPVAVQFQLIGCRFQYIFERSKIAVAIQNAVGSDNRVLCGQVDRAVHIRGQIVEVDPWYIEGLYRTYLVKSQVIFIDQLHVQAAVNFFS